MATDQPGEHDELDEWATGQLDLAAYLRRIGYAGDLAPTAATLAGLHRAHVAAIPFENADIVLGRGVRADLPSIADKLVHRGRGGYCFEHGPGYATGVFSSPLVNLYTHDIEAGLRFYRDRLGFVETFRTPREGTPEHVELKLDGFLIGLGTVEAARRVHGVEAAPGSPAMVLVVWTDNVDAAYRELTAAGVPSVQPPHDTGNSNRNALLRDPDGNLVEIVATRS